MINLKLIDKTYTNEIIINKSRFITSIYRVNSIQEIDDILSLTKKKYYDATHNCYAYILGPEANIQKCSDDGEPSKTAGFPILEVLKKNNLTNILCIVTRYFGGILLGAGGLVRAYSDSCALVVKKASFTQMKKLLKLKIRVNYSIYNNLLPIINNYHVLDTVFTDDVLIIVGINPNELDNVINTINNISSANAIIVKDDIYEIEVPISNI